MKNITAFPESSGSLYIVLLGLKHLKHSTVFVCFYFVLFNSNAYTDVFGKDGISDLKKEEYEAKIEHKNNGFDFFNNHFNTRYDLIIYVMI